MNNQVLTIPDISTTNHATNLQPATVESHLAQNHHPVTLINAPNSNLQPCLSRCRIRNGKIARLPKLERDMVNRMLFNNVPYENIVAALDELQIKVTERNISNWKTRGGYKEWCAEQDHAVQVRLHQDNLSDYLRKNDASQVPEVGLQLAATQLSQFLLKPEAQQLLTSNPDRYSKMVATLCRLTGQIQNLQKYRDNCAKELGRDYNPERIKRQEEEGCEITRNVYSAARLTDHCEAIPHRNFMPKA